MPHCRPTAPNRSTGNFMLLSLVGISVLAVLFSGCLTPAPSSSPTSSATDAAHKQPAHQELTTQPAPADLSPGLNVVYFHNFSARHLDALPQGEKASKMGRPGSPIAILDHSFGRGQVFDSGTATLIGMRMTGMIHLAQAGRYSLRAFINDGIRVYIDNHLVVDEAQWERRGNRYTEPGGFDVAQPGWFPMMIEYFQRKGTATIKLFWQVPGGSEFEIIPTHAYAHRPGGTG